LKEVLKSKLKIPKLDEKSFYYGREEYNPHFTLNLKNFKCPVFEDF
jgi:hypothetical protein